MSLRHSVATYNRIVSCRLSDHFRSSHKISGSLYSHFSLKKIIYHFLRNYVYDSDTQPTFSSIKPTCCSAIPVRDWGIGGMKGASSLAAGTMGVWSCLYPSNVVFGDVDLRRCVRVRGNVWLCRDNMHLVIDDRPARMGELRRLGILLERLLVIVVFPNMWEQTRMAMGQIGETRFSRSRCRLSPFIFRLC